MSMTQTYGAAGRRASIVKKIAWIFMFLWNNMRLHPIIRAFDYMKRRNNDECVRLLRARSGVFLGKV